ncbi:hypothetical protein D3C78_1912010 [compost metagenome]
MHDPNLAYMFGAQFYLMRDQSVLDINGLEREEVKNLLEETYELPLLSLENQGKWMFTPMLNEHQ